MESQSEKEISLQQEADIQAESLRRESILSQTSKPNIELVLDDSPEPSKDVTGTGTKRKISADTNIENRLKGPRLMNTYRLRSKKPFNVEKVIGVLKDVLTRELEEAAYEPANALKSCILMAAEIRTRVKSFNFDRYKIVCLVTIVENKMQSVLSMAKFLWDTERDKYATFSFNNSQLASMACVFGIYYE